MKRRNRPFIFLQTLLLRIAVASLPVILILSLLAPTAFARDAAYGPEALNVTIIYHGKTTKTATACRTVGELLAEQKLDVSGEDVASHGMDDRITEGMVVTVDRVITVRETYTTTVPHETSLCADASIPEGTEAVLVPGADGELLCTAEVTYVNGVETRRTILRRDLALAPVTEIIGQGTGQLTRQPEPEAVLRIEDGYIYLPTGEVLTYTGSRTIRASAYTHTDSGCDLYTATGTLVHIGTVAVDPRYIPYGTRMFILTNDGAYIYGISVAEDYGGYLGEGRMDLYFPTYSECMQFGRRECTVYFLG